MSGDETISWAETGDNLMVSSVQNVNILSIGNGERVRHGNREDVRGRTHSKEHKQRGVRDVFGEFEWLRNSEPNVYNKPRLEPIASNVLYFNSPLKNKQPKPLIVIIKKKEKSIFEESYIHRERERSRYHQEYEMKGVMFFALLCLLAAGTTVRGEDPYFYFTWNVTYGTLSPAGVPQQVILINNEFPGPNINSTSNNNLVINVFNNLDEPLLFTWYIHIS